MLFRARRSELRDAFSACRTALLGVALFSGAINILMLTGSFFMLEVYDRVLPSRSIPTLVALAMIAAVLFAFLGLLDVTRSRILARVGGELNTRLAPRIYDTIVRLPLRGYGERDSLQPLRDLDQIRSFFSGGGPGALFDLPWMPLYFLICFGFHFWIGVTATVGALILIVLTGLTEVLTRQPIREAARAGTLRIMLAESGQRNAEALQAMGMAGWMGREWGESDEDYLSVQQRASDVSGGLGGLAKTLRMVLQATVLGVGASVVIQQEATAGIIIAGSILSARALAPLDTAIENWKGFQAARQGRHRLHNLLEAVPPLVEPMPLPPPAEKIGVEHVSVAPPGVNRLVVQDVSFNIENGDGLGIIGPSASGKSSLARSLVGVWTPARGRIRLDGAALDQWSPEALGRHIGYLPQDVELFDGNIAQNIARFDPGGTAAAIIAAAQTAGVHDMILRLPEGYQTVIGWGGEALSAGQRQRIALARALYGDPFLVVLDEPNSNLDGEGEEALTRALLSVRDRGGIVIVIAHRPSALAAVSKVLVMADGKVQAYRPKEDVLQKVLRPRALPTRTGMAVTGT